MASRSAGVSCSLPSILGAGFSPSPASSARPRGSWRWGPPLRRPPRGQTGRRSGGPHLHDPLGLADDAGLGEKPAPKMDGSEQLTPAEREAMNVLELSWRLTRAAVKSRYKALVKLHHPDAKGGAREAEEKLKEINAAYSTLRASENVRAV